MGKGDDKYGDSETGNWNVAKEYSKVKIMKNLSLADDYATIAKFGFVTMQDELYNLDIDKNIMRYKGFQRLLESLIKVINNAIFAVKGTDDKKKLNKYEKTLKQIEKLLPTTIKKKIDQVRRTSSMEIIESKFSYLLELTLKIGANINEPLNKNDLIFMDKEEFDPKSYKKKIIGDVISRG